jgi:hypothetical protein
LVCARLRRGRWRPTPRPLTGQGGGLGDRCLSHILGIAVGLLRHPFEDGQRLVIALQRPLPDGTLGIVLRGEKQDGRLEDVVNLAASASTPHAELPLPLLDGTPDRPNDAATIAVIENAGRKSGQ